MEEGLAQDVIGIEGLDGYSFNDGCARNDLESILL